jgi:hypothetical protein
MGAEPEHKAGFVEREGVRIYFEVVGEGPPVVLLHGAAGTAPCGDTPATWTG